MSSISNLHLNAIPKSYCYCCVGSQLNVSLKEQNDNYITCPFGGCTNIQFSNISNMYYCNMCNLLFELSHAHCLKDKSSHVYNVVTIVNYDYNGDTYSGLPQFLSFDDMENEFNDITNITKKCLCNNTGLCGSSDITTHNDIITGDCTNTF